jgi:hypothetical protein
MKLSQLPIVLVLSVVALGSAGCAAQTAAAGDAPLLREDLPAITASAEQEQAIADGHVTEGEYKAGFARYEACMKKEGYELVGVKQADYLITYSITNEAVATGADDRCYIGEFQQLDASWQIANEDRSITTKMYQKCLSERGIRADTTAKGVWKQINDAGIPPEDCLPK